MVFVAVVSNVLFLPLFILNMAVSMTRHAYYVLRLPAFW